tara:strand:- start:2 stop:595 length:594 start_codon:yes stop_codon:yes gene_type:complete
MTQLQNEVSRLERLIDIRTSILNSLPIKNQTAEDIVLINKIRKYTSAEAIRNIERNKSRLGKIRLESAIADLIKAAESRVLMFKVLNPRLDLNGLYQESVDGRTPIDIYYFKKLLKVIHINGKATLVTRSLEQPVTWRGTTGNNITIMDRSQGKKVIYQAHRVLYAITTGIDPVASDIGYIDENVDNYAFSNLIYKG